MNAPEPAAAGEASRCSLLIDQLTAKDRVAIVVYAGSAGLVLPIDAGQREGHDPRRGRSAGRRRLDQRRPAASGWPTKMAHKNFIPAASTASSWPPTATSTSASPARASWSA